MVDVGSVKDLLQNIDFVSMTQEETESAIRYLPRIKVEEQTEDTKVEIVEESKKKGKRSKKKQQEEKAENNIRVERQQTKGKEKKSKDQLTRELLNTLVRHYQQDYVKMTTNIVTSETDGDKILDLTRKQFLFMNNFQGCINVIESFLD